MLSKKTGTSKNSIKDTNARATDIKTHTENPKTFPLPGSPFILF
jgi:hypothetical protein